MKWILISASAFLSLISLTGADTPRDLYSTRYDSIDIDTILNSNRLVMNYVDCLLNRKPCAPEGKDLKRILPEALRTKCGRCSPNQKENALKVIRRLYERYPKQYNELREKWDPTGEYHRRFENYLREEQFNIISERPTPVNNNKEVTNVQKIPPPSPVPSTRPTTGPVQSTNIITVAVPANTAGVQTVRPTQAPITLLSQAPVTRPTRSQEGNGESPNQVPDERLPSSSAVIGNRFGGEDFGGEELTPAEAPQVLTSLSPAPVDPAPVTVRTTKTTAGQTTSIKPPSNTVESTSGTEPNTGLTSSVIFQVVAGVSNRQPQPVSDQEANTPQVIYVMGNTPQNGFSGIAGLIGNKITTTTDIIAGLIKKSVSIFLG